MKLTNGKNTLGYPLGNFSAHLISYKYLDFIIIFYISDQCTNILLKPLFLTNLIW